MAMILAAAAVLHYAGEAASSRAQAVSGHIYESVFETTAAGIRTLDLGGHAGTTEFTDEVIELVRSKVQHAEPHGPTGGIGSR
jgi:isocitrate dehydrogenase (NAD+)